jgi:hypothetical protein
MDWTLQFQNTDWTFWIPNLLVAFGPVIIVGKLGALVSLTRRNANEKVGKIFALWSLAFLVFIAITYLKFIRYSAPLLPFMSLFAAKLLWDIRKTLMGTIISIGMVAASVVWGVAFFHIYLVTHTSLQARDWIVQNIPPKAIILKEEWNSILRFDTAPLMDKRFGFLSLNFYTPDEPMKQQRIQDAIKQSDYVIIESPKIYNTIKRNPGKYVKTMQFYEELENNSAFTKVVEFTSYPQLGPWRFMDEFLEETWYAFDHPTIRIYKTLR